ncbi:MAG: hypothetical protein NWE88_07020 [Candidatus Bathyarchaeota archaeon]|nr:hypothetical protein [Candidatus Bathyarchaeota archaeon]
MQFIWSEGGDAVHSEREIWNALKLALIDDTGICYHRYPVFSADRSRKEPDFLILHRENGLYVIYLLECQINHIKNISEDYWEMQNWESLHEFPLNDSEDQIMAVLNKFRNERKLRKKRKVVIQGHIYIALPNITKSEFVEKGFGESPSDSYSIIFADDLEVSQLREKLHQIPNDETQAPITDEQWSLALGVLQGTPVLRRIPRAESSNLSSKSAMLRKVETRMLSMDREQHSLAIQIPPGPQRIRGLSGSGKTIVMCMKAAFMHRRHPEWTIVYTFYTKSLYGMIQNLITRFYQYWSEDNSEPDWTKIRVMHGWGGKSQPGVYSTIAEAMSQEPRTFRNARNYFSYRESNEILGKCCNELIDCGTEIPELFDAILIDEGQDFHFSFYRLCLHCLKDPKRLIWAYDEVQSLESLAIPTTIDIFGTNDDGTPKISLDGTYEEGEIEKDVILYRCYRTPRPVLVAAHVFGMGLLRPEGAVQFIPNSGGWEDIGYEIVSGSFTPGQTLTITRPKRNSPHLLEDLVGFSELVQWKSFDSINDEIVWIADQIQENIETDELRPEEILVIALDWKKMSQNFTLLRHLLNERDVNSIRPGYGSSSSSFQIEGHVTFSGIFPAKGNEASIVYIIDFEKIGENNKIIVQLRNQAFTAMTRTRGWVIITGVGDRANHLFQELDLVMRKPDDVTFTVPDPSRIQRNLDSLEYERRRNRIKKARRLASELRRVLAEIDDPILRQQLIDRLSG